MTKKRLRMTFSTPAIVRYVSGRFVSPLALSTPLPKLNIPIAGIPSAYIFRYNSAPSINSSFVFSSSSSGREKTKHSSPTTIPMSTHITNDEQTVRSVPRSSPAPRRRAAQTFTPLPMPSRKPMNRDTSSDVDPTAPSAL